jgi:hypothetical protein
MCYYTDTTLTKEEGYEKNNRFINDFTGWSHAGAGRA